MEKGGAREVKSEFLEDFWKDFLNNLLRDGESKVEAGRLRRRAGVVLGVGGHWAAGVVGMFRSAF